MTFRALDLFCGGGGTARGLFEAGFTTVVGVDNSNHARAYPGHFIRADALRPPVHLGDFDFIWASPPCQAYSKALALRGRDYIDSLPKLIPPVRRMLAGAGVPYAIENVPKAVRRDLVLTGPMVGLPRLLRERWFEMAGFWWWQQPVNRRTDGPAVSIVGRGASFKNSYKTKLEALRVMGLPDDCLMTRAEVVQSVPPAYARLIGRQVLADIRNRRARP